MCRVGSTMCTSSNINSHFNLWNLFFEYFIDKWHIYSCYNIKTINTALFIMFVCICCYSKIQLNNEVSLIWVIWALCAVCSTSDRNSYLRSWHIFICCTPSSFIIYMLYISNAICMCLRILACGGQNGFGHGVAMCSNVVVVVVVAALVLALALLHSSLICLLSAIAGARTHKLIGIRIFIFTSHVHSNVISTSQYLCNVYVQCIFACNEYTETEACVMFTTLKD